MQREHVTSSPIAWRRSPVSTGVLGALARVALDERLAEEARHLVAADRARRLERREGQHGQVERVVVARVAVEQPGERAGGGEAAGEGRHDRRRRRR